MRGAGVGRAGAAAAAAAPLTTLQEDLVAVIEGDNVLDDLLGVYGAWIKGKRPVVQVRAELESMKTLMQRLLPRQQQQAERA